MKQTGCELCETEGGVLVLSNEFLRVVLVDDAAFPGFVRVIWNDHVREMTDLASGDQQRLLQTVLTVEHVQREVMTPAKINLASLGNLTPHLHWHVIPRFADDSHFPQPVWGARQRDSGEAAARRQAKLGALRWRLAEAVSRLHAS